MPAMLQCCPTIHCTVVIVCKQQYLPIGPVNTIVYTSTLPLGDEHNTTELLSHKMFKHQLKVLFWDMLENAIWYSHVILNLTTF